MKKRKRGGGGEEWRKEDEKRLERAKWEKGAWGEAK